MSADILVIGYAAPEARTKTRQRMTDFVMRLSELSGIDIGLVPLPSYYQVARRLHQREIDLAWLSPVPLISLTTTDSAIPLVSLHRDQLVHYRCALIVPSSSAAKGVESLRGGRAAWVDRHSASGYVLGRIELASHGIRGGDLASEQFLGSHDAVVRAVASGQADFGATFARTARNGKITGSWSRTPGLSRSISILKAFGEIPPDAIVARRALGGRIRTKLSDSLFRMAEAPKDRLLVSEALGADSFHAPEHTMYDRLHDLVFDAFRAGHLTSLTQEDIVMSADATVEQRVPPDVPTRRQLDAEVSELLRSTPSTKR